MIRKFIFMAAVLTGMCAGAQETGKVTFAGGKVTIEFPTEGTHKIKYLFQNCMANDLFTFLDVTMDGVLVNSARYSDNIGPFLISGGAWTGGNHLTGSNQKTAKTLSYRVAIDGNDLTDNVRGATATRVDIYVNNELYVPTNLSYVFAEEEVHYTVMGNSIQVETTHRYKYGTPLRVERYYGMQSMFIDENEILTPQGACSRWTPVSTSGKSIDFNKGDYPDFSLFVEHSTKTKCYQAAYMTRDGIGDRHLVQPTDVVFIGNSYSKSYHKTIGGAVLKYGDETYWKGVYSWFVNPLADTTAENGYFAYNGYFDGEPAVFSASDTEKAGVKVSGGVDNVVAGSQVKMASVSAGAIVIAEEYDDASVYTVSGSRVASGAGRHSLPAGLYIVADRNGHVQKLVVK